MFGQSKPPVGTPLNEAHPLSAGLVCWPFWERCGISVYDTACQYKGTLTNGSAATTPGWSGSRYGSSVRVAPSGAIGLTTTQYIDFGNIFNQTTGSFSVACLAAHPSNPSSANGAPDVVGKRAQAATLTGYAFNIPAGSGAGFVATIGDGVNVVLTTSVSIANNLSHVRLMVVDRKTQMLTLYINGQLISSNSIAAVGSLSTSTSLVMGCRRDATGLENTFVGALDALWLWPTRALTALDAAQHGAQPFCMFNTGIAGRKLFRSKGRLGA